MVCACASCFYRALVLACSPGNGILLAVVGLPDVVERVDGAADGRLLVTKVVVSVEMAAMLVCAALYMRTLGMLAE